MKIVPRVIAPQINPPGPRPAPTESVATDSFGGSIKTAATRLETAKSLDLSGTRQQVVGKISEHVLSQPCITEGLDQAYSPNHPGGMTTRVHIEHQIKVVNHYVGAETAAVNALQAGDYAALHAMVALGALQPSLAVAGSPEGALAVLRETQKIFSPDQGITLLTGPGSKLTMRGGETGVELGWRN